jgi:hypothetical protein
MREEATRNANANANANAAGGASTLACKLHVAFTCTPFDGPARELLLNEEACGLHMTSF